MGGIPKMLLPTPHGSLLSVLCERMRVCNIERIHLLATNGMADILRPHVSENVTLYKGQTATMSAAVLLLRPFVGDNPVAFGMPDTYFEDENAFCKLRAALKDGADVAVGIFRTRPEQRHKLGMVDVVGDYWLVNVIDKPSNTTLEWAWGVLAWKPIFWDCLQASDPHVGYGLPSAIDSGLDVRAVRMDGGYWDCGTNDEYFHLVNHLTGVK